MADEKDKRTRQIEERKQFMREVNPPAPRVRVTPTSDELRRVLIHPTERRNFPDSGSAEWPDDTFTRARIEEGALTLEDQPKQQGSKKPAQAKSQDSAAPGSSSSNPAG